MLNRRGSVPIVFLVVLAVALFAFTLIAFSVSRGNIDNEMDSLVSKVEEFNGLRDNFEFSGISKEFKPLSKKRYGFFGEEILLVNIRVK